MGEFHDAAPIPMAMESSKKGEVFDGNAANPSFCVECFPIIVCVMNPPAKNREVDPFVLRV